MYPNVQTCPRWPCGRPTCPERWSGARNRTDSPHSSVSHLSALHLTTGQLTTRQPSACAPISQLVSSQGTHPGEEQTTTWVNEEERSQ